MHAAAAAFVFRTRAPQGGVVMNVENQKPVAIGDAIPNAGRTGWRFALFVCFLVVVLDGFNTTSISFVVPTLARDWQLSAAAFTPAFVPTNVGAAFGFIGTWQLH